MSKLKILEKSRISIKKQTFNELYNTDAKKEIGETSVKLVVTTEFNWIARRQFESDYGIDLHIGIRDGNDYPSGKLIAVQVKAGESYVGNNEDTSVE